MLKLDDEIVKVIIDSSQDKIVNFKREIDENKTILLQVWGNQELTLNIDVKVHNNANLTMLIVNDNNAPLTINDKYDLAMNSQSKIAYSFLNNYEITTNSFYQLLGSNADLKVLSASISQNKKRINQDVKHLAGLTSANVDNYGVVLENGDCQMIVKNTIAKGYHKCSTHQTNRLLTTSKTSKGKILPILCIDDDDVAASHGCSLGKADENQIYYLQSRGLSYRQALNLITVGYLMPITHIIDDNQINEVLKNEINSKVIIDA